MAHEPGTTYDAAVIGAGVVGCAVARGLAMSGARTALVERTPDILGGASKGNSAILHTGFDAPAGSLELACMQAGYREFMEIRERLNLPLLRTGALLAAWNEEDLARLPGIVEHAHANGVTDVARIDREDLLRREPNLAPQALGAVLVPGEHVIDPWSTPLALARQAQAHGAALLFGREVTGGRFDGETWTLETPGGPLRAGVVVNCAGLYGDRVENINRESPFHVTPRKGQFVVFDKTAARLINSIILPVPTERTKGVLLARTIFGNLLVGPTAEDQEDRERATVEEATLRGLIAAGDRMLPGLARQPVSAVYAGLRPATQFKEYQIEAHPERRWITVGGIRSTGLTSGLGIAAHVRRLFREHFGGLGPPEEPLWTPVPSLSEYHPRPYQQADPGEIVCHCELVTRAEIEAALRGPVPARTLGGLKRRTRCMMGRCQGFYCGRRVAELAEEHLAEPLTLEDAP